MLTVFIKAFVPRRRQTACTKDLPVRGLCCAFYLVAPGPVLSGRGVDFLQLCGGLGIGDRAHPTAPQRITTVGIPPAVRLRLVLMPISLSCFSAASFYGLCPPRFFVFAVGCWADGGFSASTARPRVVWLVQLERRPWCAALAWFTASVWPSMQPVCRKCPLRASAFAIAGVAVSIALQVCS